jgi:FO synthase subunit 1
VTDDYINPDYAWPALDELESIASEAGVPLRERLPTHERYLPDAFRRAGVEGAPGTWLRPMVRAALGADDEAGRRYRALQ